MAKGKPSLTIVYTLTARDDLIRIWNYNAKHRSVNQANSYEDFLLHGIARLSQDYDRGQKVEGFPELKSLILIKRHGGDGHVVIYEIKAAEGTVNVLHIFHTKQDWPRRL